MNKIPGSAFLFAAVVLSLAGVAAFVFLFVRDFNVYWLILSPVILAVYEIPAVLFLWLYKKKRSRLRQEDAERRS